MKNKREMKIKIRKGLLIGIIFISIISLIFLVSALTSELEIELNSLVSDLEGSNYSWLVDYNINYPSVEVYESPRDDSGEPKNKIEKIADFGIIDENKKYQVFLTNLGKGNSYDNETEILTENGWKYFYELNNEKVAALNQKTNKLEWQLPSKKHSFDYSGEMYKIILEDESELLVSPKHNVYSGQNLLTNSFGERTFEGNNLLNILSPEKIGQSNLSASAKYGTSLRCLESNSSALGRNSKNSDLGINVICFNTNFKVSSNISLDNPDILNILSLCFSNSVNKNSGATNSNLLNKELEANTPKGLPFFNKDERKQEIFNHSYLRKNPNERTTLTSTTNSILDHSKYLFDNASFILSENSSTFSSVNLDFDNPLFNLAISSSLNLTNLLNNTAQSTFETCLINSNSSGISNLISVMNLNKNSEYLNLSEFYDVGNDIILVKKEKGSNGMAEPNSLNNFPLQNNILHEPKYLKLSDSMKGSARGAEWYTRLPDKQFSLTGNAGSNPVPGALSFSKKDFSLQSITEVYDSINAGNEIYFLNSDNEPVKVELISKENYNGKIYDVDVGNDIILVKRNSNNEKKEKGSNGMAEPNRLNNFPPQNNISYNPKYLKLSDSMKGSARVAEWYTRLPDKQFSSTGNAGSNPVPGALSFSKKQNNIEVNGKLINIDGGIWSGNSETYSQNIFDLKILGGSVEFDYIVDPIILGNANSTNTNTTYENNFTHLNVSNSSIVAYYPFDDNVSATTTYDYTDNSRDGTITGGAVYNNSQTIYGGAMTFDGNGDFINISSSDSINFNRTEPFSISLWLKPHQLNVQQSLIDKRNPTTSQIDYFLYIDSINRLQFLIQGEGGATDSISGRVSNLVYVFPANIWTHIVMTYDGSSTFSGVKIYINSSNKATLIATDSLTGNPNSTGNLAIGAQNASGTPVQYFKGDIDEPMIFNRELSSTEVSAIYNNQTSRFHGTGEMNYTNVNFAGNDTINITLAGCQQNMGTSLRAKVNDGAYVNFDSSCFIKDYNATGNLNSANVTVGFVSDAYNFYTPLVIGNISLESNPVFPTISYDPQTPADNSTINSNSIYVNVSAADSNFENMSYSLYNESLNISGLVGYWNFDRNTTLVNDLSGNNNDGTRSGGVNWTTGGKLGEGFYFDGTDDYINIDTAVGDLATTTTGTWSAWVKPRDATPTALMIPISFGDTAGTSDDIELRVETTGKLGAQNIVTTARWYFTTDSTTLLTDNQWTHVAIVHDNTAPVMYVNGVLTAITFAISVDKTTWSDNTPNLDNGRIGSRNINGGGNVNFFNGSIDEPMIFNKALSATDVSELYNRQLVNHTTYSSITPSINWTGLADNDYNYFVDVIDDAENYNSTLLRNVEVDTTFPTLSFASPTTNTSNLSQDFIQANVSFTETNINITNISLYNSTQNIINSTTGTTSPLYINFSGLTDGTYYLNATINDLAGNTNYSETRRILLDTINPLLNITFPNNNSFSSQTNLSINYTRSDALAGLSTCWYSNDTYTANTTLANCGNITTVQWAEGQHNLTIWVNDTANSVNSSMVTFTIDTTKPTISYDPETPADNSTINSNSIYVNVSVADSNFENMSYSLYNESLNISGLVGYWNFDRNTTTIRDLSKQGNDGTRAGGVNWTTGGKLGNGFSFDGTDDYIDVPDSNSLDITSAISISAWIKTSIGSTQYIITKHDDSFYFGVGISTANKLGFYLNGVSSAWLEGTSNLNDNNWHNVVGIYNGTTILVYVDGVQENSVVRSGAILSGATSVEIGARSSGTLFTGNIDEPMIFNRALSSTEISELYNRSLVNHTTYSTITESINWTSLADNDYNYFADVIDEVENYNSTLLRNVEVDTTFPTWTANETNLTSSTLNGKGVYFNITLADANPNTYIFSWYNGTAWENTTSSYINNQEVSISKTINIDIATINWTWFINDSANNLNQTDIWSITLLADDNAAPNISFANPTTNATNLSQNFIFANLSFADATSSISMANISLFNSTQNIINSTQGTTSTLEINFTGLSDGTYYLNASVNDTLGNRNQTETRKIILDATAPNLTINSPTTGTYSTSTILFNATSLDATTLVDSCWYTINSGTTNRTLSRDGATNYYNFTQTSISDSTYTARFYCNDSAKNINNTQNVAFTIDTSVPIGGGPAPTTAGGGGAGAPSKPALKRIFNLEYNMYDQTISLNQVEFDKLGITNNGEVAEEYTIEVKTIDNIISFEEKKIKLAPGEAKNLEFKIVSSKEPGIYTGKIIVSNGVSEREVLVTINVKTEKSLFDITLTIPESLKILLTGQNLISKIDLIQMGLKENIDVTLNYMIKDFEGQTYLSESETIAVLDQKSFEKEFFTGELSPGQYVLGTELIHPDGVAVASTHFVVQEKGIKFGKREILLSLLILVLILISLIIFLSIRKYKRVGKALKEGKK